MGKNKNWFIESTVEAGEVVINDGGSSVDFRIEGDTDSNLLVTDGSADKVGIGTNTPDTKLHVTSDTIGTLLSVSNHNVSSSMPSEMVLQKSRGSKLAPATLANSDEVGKITFKGYDGSSYDEIAHIKVSSSDVSSDTSSMTFHSDKFVLDTGTLQFGTTGQAISSVSTAITSASADTELATAKSVHTAIAAGVDASVVANELVFNGCTDAANRYKMYFLSNHASNGTMAAADVKTDGTYFHFGGDTDTNFKVKVTGATSITGATTITGATQVTGALTVGVDDTGHDVKFFGATSGKYMLWDESADSLILGVDDTGVDFKAFGATSGRYLEWDESEDKLNVLGDVQLGAVIGNEIYMKGKMAPVNAATSVNMKAFNTLQTADIFIITDKNSADAFSVEADGKVVINKDLSFANPHQTSVNIGALAFGDTGSQIILDYDRLKEGNKSFKIAEGEVSRIEIDTNDNLTFAGTTFTSTTSSETKFKTDKLKVNSVSDSATRGIIEVGKVTTSSGGLTLDSALGTVTVADNLVVDGTLTLNSDFNIGETTSATLMIDKNDSNLGLAAIDLTNNADNTATGLAINKWLHLVDTNKTTGTAGLVVEKIHSEDIMQISTKDAADLLILAPAINYNGGTVAIGTSASKSADLLCYGNATVTGNLSVTGSISGSVNLNATTSTSFQLDSAGSGPHFIVGSDDLIQTTTSDESTPNQIHTVGILLDSVYGASTNMAFASYNGYMKMQPGTNANTSRYLSLEGSIKISNSGALTYNYIGGSNKIGAEVHGSFAATDDLATGDTIIYTDGGKCFFDASADIASLTTMDLIFGASNASGADSTDNKEVKFYGNNTAAYMQWLQSSNKLLVMGTEVGTTNFQVQTGKAVFGRDGVDSTDVEFFGAAGAILNIDAGNSYCKFDQGIRKSPNVKAATVTLTQQESGRPIIIKNKTADSVYTLPAVAVGLNYKFMIVEKDGAFDVEIKSPDGANFFYGGVTHLDTDAGSGNDEIRTQVSDNDSNDFLTLTLVEAGSMVEMYCDGTNWFVTGHVASATAPTFGDASGL